jgi:hypothetical protein
MNASGVARYISPRLLAGVILLALAILYFLLAPLFMRGGSAVRPRELRDLQQARDYYSVLSSWFTVLSAAIGLALGYVYYWHRYREDERRALFERTRENIRVLTNLLDQYDSYLCEILSANFHDHDALRFVREKAVRIFDNIYAMLDESVILTNPEVRKVMALHSFVEKEYELMHCSLEHLRESVPVLMEKGDEYALLLREARRTLYRRLWQEQGQ